MKKLVYPIVFVFLLACGASVGDVKPGMTESEVMEILGEPNHKTMSVSTYSSNGDTSSTSSGRWEYEGKGSIEFQDGIVAAVKEN